MFSFTKRNCNYCGGSFQCALIVFSIFIIGIYFVSIDFIWRYVVEEEQGVFLTTKCTWKSGDPVLLYLKTKLGVNYEGGHWFHMAENFLTQHSILPYEERYSDIAAAQDLYLELDDVDILNGMNSFTRMLSVVGMSALNSPSGSYAANDIPNLHMNVKNVYFVYAKSNGHDGGVFETCHHITVQGDSDIASSNFVYKADESRCSSKILKHATRSLLQVEQKSSISYLRGMLAVAEANTIGSVFYDQKAGFHEDVFGTVRVGHNSNDEGTCIKPLGPVGGMWPTPQRGHWFPTPEDLSAFHRKLDIFCPLSYGSRPAGSKKYKLSIYQRDLNRKLINLEETLELLFRDPKHTDYRKNIPILNKAEWDVEVIMHDDNRSPCELRTLLQYTNVLMTPHGFQSMLIMFLPFNYIPVGATKPVVPLLFEIFPYRYYKRAYGPLSRELGVYHSSAMSPVLTEDRSLLLSLVPTSVCMLTVHCREYARGDNVKFTERSLDILLYEIATKIVTQY